MPLRAPEVRICVCVNRPLRSRRAACAVRDRRGVRGFGEQAEVLGRERRQEHPVGQRHQIRLGERVLTGGAEDEERADGVQCITDVAVGGIPGFSGSDQREGVGVHDADRTAQGAQRGGQPGSQHPEPDHQDGSTDDLVGGQQLTQPSQAGIGDLGVAQVGLELGSGQIEHGDTEYSGGGDAFESRDGQLQRALDTSRRVPVAVAVGEEPTIVDDQDLAARGVGGVDELLDSGEALGQFEGVVCGCVEGGVVQYSAGETLLEQGGVHPIPVAGLIAFGQRVDPLGGDARPVGAEEEPESVLHVVVTEDQRPPCPHGVGCGVSGEQGMDAVIPASSAGL